MRIEYINPFIDASVEILTEVLGENVNREELYLKENSSSTLGLCILIGVPWDVTGRILIDMAQNTGTAIAERMNSETIPEMNQLVKATLGELANMIVGRAITKLHILGFDFNISPPTLLIGDKIEITTLQLEAVSVPLSTPDGKVEVNVAVKETDE